MQSCINPSSGTQGNIFFSVDISKAFDSSRHYDLGLWICVPRTIDNYMLQPKVGS